MDNLVRVTYKAKDKGIMVRESEVPELADPKSALYQSLYYYGEDALEYFNKNRGSIRGYKGKVTTPFIIFDIDSKDLEVSKQNTIILIDWLKEQGLYNEYAAKIAFSGSKGFHLTLNTSYEFTSKELKSLCMYISNQVPFVEEAGFKRVDPSIYNTNRQFRVVNTKNPKSGLFKIEMVESELRNCTMDKIKEAAAQPQQTYPFESKIDDKPIRAILLQLKEDKKEKRENKAGMIKTFMGANIKRKKCIDIIQEGEMKDGESNSGLLRLASYYRRQGYTREQCKSKLEEAAFNRKKKYPTTNDIDDEKLEQEILYPVYSTEGYIFTCEDWFLKLKCEGACEFKGKHSEPHKQVSKPFNQSKPKPTPVKEPKASEQPFKPSVKTGFGTNLQPSKPKTKEETMSLSGFKTIKQVSGSFKEFAEGWKESRIETGIKELDGSIRILPTGLTVVNARPGVGKTTLALNMMENCAQSGKNVLFYSIDMPEDEFYQKAKSKALKISPDDVLDLYFSQDEEAKQLQVEGDEVVGKMLDNVYTNYEGGVTPEKIDADLAAFKEAGIEISLVIIDFLQKMKNCGDSSGSNIGPTLVGLKSVQRRHSTGMVVLSQIPRGQGRVNEETPVLTAAAGLGGTSIEANASIIINMWRPMKFYRDENGSQDKYMGYTVAKNRMGECTEGTLSFNGAISEIRSMTDEEIEEYEITKSVRREKEQPNVNKGFGNV